MLSSHKVYLNLPAVQAFVKKVEEIQQEPYKLRRSIAAWPYYDTLRISLLPLFESSNELPEDVKQWLHAYPIIPNLQVE